MLSSLKAIWDNPLTFWIILAIPSIGMIGGAFDSATDLESLLHPSGEFSARLMIIAMIISPFRLLFPKSAGWRWMLQRRRHIGVAAFGYGLLHTIIYLVDLNSLSAIWADVFKLGIWTGWLAFLIFVPLAITSNNYFVKRLGRGWKKLQRWVYVAAVATLLHWLFVHNNFGPALVHFVPLALLEGYRIWKNQSMAKAAPVRS